MVHHNSKHILRKYGSQTQAQPQVWNPDHWNETCTGWFHWKHWMASQYWGLKIISKIYLTVSQYTLSVSVSHKPPTNPRWSALFYSQLISGIWGVLVSEATKRAVWVALIRMLWLYPHTKRWQWCLWQWWLKSVARGVNLTVKSGLNVLSVVTTETEDVVQTIYSSALQPS